MMELWDTSPQPITLVHILLYGGCSSDLEVYEKKADHISYWLNFISFELFCINQNICKTPYQCITTHAGYYC